MISQAAQTTWKGRMIIVLLWHAGGRMSVGWKRTVTDLRRVATTDCNQHPDPSSLSTVKLRSCFSYCTFVHPQTGGTKVWNALWEKKEAGGETPSFQENGKSGDVRLSLRPAPIQEEVCTNFWLYILPPRAALKWKVGRLHTGALCNYTSSSHHSSRHPLPSETLW